MGQMSCAENNLSYAMPKCLTTILGSFSIITGKFREAGFQSLPLRQSLQSQALAYH